MLTTLLAALALAAPPPSCVAASDAAAAYQASLPRKRTPAQARRLDGLERAALACVDGEQPLPFFPQAGRLGADLYLTNTVDLADGAGLRDPWCGRRTYDGHNGEDVVIRSFREQAIGVPVFAALDGRVLEVQSGFKDTSYGNQTLPWDNHVIVDSGHGQQAVYGHFRRGSITLKLGDWVVAGQQIGLTGSSGNSSWPHLHFTTFRDFQVVEPWTGPCRPGPSLWSDEPVVSTDPYARDFALSARPFTGRAALPWDESVRTGTFAPGARDLYFRSVLLNADGIASMHVRILRPDGSVAVDDANAGGGGWRQSEASWHYRLDLSVVGEWTITIDAGDRRLVTAPFTVASTSANRAPLPVQATLSRSTVGTWTCDVTQDLVRPDPDYDLVRYRYVWTVGARVVRTVTSAALSDMISRRVAPAGTIACAVTPSDGKLTGPTARTTA